MPLICMGEYKSPNPLIGVLPERGPQDQVQNTHDAGEEHTISTPYTPGFEHAPLICLKQSLVLFPFKHLAAVYRSLHQKCSRWGRTDIRLLNLVACHSMLSTFFPLAIS